MNAAAYTLMSRLHYGEEEEKNARTLVLQCSACDARPRGKVTPVVVDGSRHPRRRRRPHIPLILQARFPIPIHWNPLKLLHPFASLCSSCRLYIGALVFFLLLVRLSELVVELRRRGAERKKERERDTPLCKVDLVGMWRAAYIYAHVCCAHVVSRLS